MHRIRLSNVEFEGQNNAYLLDSDGRLALVDTGIATPETRRRLEDGLAKHGYGFADVEAVLLTHWHPDHAGLAGEIQDAGDAAVYAHEADAPLVRQEPDALEELVELMRRRFDEWGMPAHTRGPLLARFDNGHRLSGVPPQVDAIADGDRIEAGGLALTVVHVPGHTAGLCCFSGGTKAFVGDAVLPSYTPNIGGADVRIEHPLGTYVASLRRLDRLGLDRMYPGHRETIDVPAARITEIVNHHRERLGRVLAVLREGPADAWTVSAELFGDLQGIHVLHGPGEAFAHLDHLEEHGVARREDREYRLVEELARAADLL